MKELVIKIGGAVSSDASLLGTMAAEIREFQASRPCLLVHGGGVELSGLMRQVGMQPIFRDGIRMTTAEEMAYVDMVLSGQVNKRLVRLFQASGINAVGLSGSDGRLFQGCPISEDSRTGTVSQIDTSVVESLLRSCSGPRMRSDPALGKLLVLRGKDLWAGHSADYGWL